jgi:hypothetical protein
VTMTVLLTNIMNWTNDRKKTAGEIRRCLGVIWTRPILVISSFLFFFFDYAFSSFL